MSKPNRIHDPYLEAILDHLRTLPEARAATVVDVRVGPFWTVVETTAGTGMASTCTHELRPCGRHPITAAGGLHELGALELAELSLSPSAPESAVGVAAINSLLPYPDCATDEGNAEEEIRRRGRNGRVAIIGHFPFAKTLQPECSDVWIFERGNRLQTGDLPAEQMAEVLPVADVVAISATTLSNHTLSSIMSLVPKESFILMLGPSTPMVAVLFDHGFDALCGTWLDEGEAARLAASQGAVLKQITAGRRLICRREPA